jgi:hypothetical protein
LQVVNIYRRTNRTREKRHRRRDLNRRASIDFTADDDCHDGSALCGKSPKSIDIRKKILLDSSPVVPHGLACFGIGPKRPEIGSRQVTLSVALTA